MGITNNNSSPLQNRTRYNENFKRETVQVLLESGKPVTSFAQTLGIEQSILYRWKKKYEQELRNVSANSATVSPEEYLELKNELEDLKKNVAQLRNIVQRCFQDKYTFKP